MFFLISIAAATSWGSYKFHDNIGGVFYDYSGNGYHGINGQQVLADNKDALLTDRGAYFKTTSGLITLHNTVWETPILSDSFSLYLWTYLVSPGILLLRCYSSKEKLFQVSFTQQFYIQFQIKTFNSSDYMTITSHSQLTTNNWVFLTLKIQSDCSSYTFGSSVQIDDQSWPLNTIQGQCYKQEQESLTFIGYQQFYSFQGWIYQTRFGDILSTKYDGAQFNPACEASDCYFGENDQKCQCQNCAGQVCISKETDQILAGDGSFCFQCQGMCTSNAVCVNCPQQDWPTCQKNHTSLSENICFKDCGGCFGPEANQCLTCANTYANLMFGACSCPENSIEIKGVCTCLYYYVLLQNQDGLFSCEPCESPCETCVGSVSHCLSCVDKKASVNEGECICPENSSWNGQSCVCNQGFYTQCQACSQLICNQCDSSCLTCDGPQKTSCLSCRPEDLFIEQDSSCFGCGEGQYITEQVECDNCFNDCLTCLNHQICTSCVDQEKVINQEGKCVLQCERGYYFSKNQCLVCPDLCIDCIQDGICEECIETADWIGYSCKCKEGYHQQLSDCVLTNISCYLSTDNPQNLEIIFSKELEQDVTKADLKIKIEYDPEFEFQVHNKNQTVVLKMEYKEKIYENSEVVVEIKKDFVGKDGSILQTRKVSGIIKGFVPIDIRYIEGFISMGGGFLIALFYVGMMLADFCSPLWILITTMQYLGYQGLQANTLTPHLRAFLSSLNQWLLYPNVFYHTIGYSGSRPYDQAVKYGLVFNDFIINSGKQLSLFFVILVIAVILKCLKCSSSIVQNERYIKVYEAVFNGAFLRFWLIFYMDFAVFSLVRVLNVISIQVNQVSYYSLFDNLLAGAVLVVIFKQFLIFSPIFMFFFIMFKKELFKNTEQKNFYQKWSTLIGEFDIQKTPYHYQYYFFFLVMRIATVGTLIFFIHFPTFQALFIAFQSLCFFVYLLWYQPFVSEIMKFFSSFMQGLTVAILMLFPLFLMDFQEFFKQFLGFIIIVVVSCGYILAATLMAYLLFKYFSKNKALSTSQNQDYSPNLQRLDTKLSKPPSPIQSKDTKLIQKNIIESSEDSNQIFQSSK